MPTSLMADSPAEHLVMPMKVGIHVFAY